MQKAFNILIVAALIYVAQDRPRFYPDVLMIETVPAYDDTLYSGASYDDTLYAAE